MSKPLEKLNKFELSMETCWMIIATFLMSAMLIILPDLTFASGSVTADDNAIAKTLCNVVNVLQGKAGKAIATITMGATGIGLFFGKIQWGVFLAVAAGIAMIFGAQTIVSVISGGGTVDCAQSLENIN